MQIDEIAKIIKKAMIDAGINRKTVSLESGISETMLSLLFQGKRNFQFEHGRALEDLFKKRGVNTNLSRIVNAYCAENGTLNLSERSVGKTKMLLILDLLDVNTDNNLRQKQLETCENGSFFEVKKEGIPYVFSIIANNKHNLRKKSVKQKDQSLEKIFILPKWIPRASWEDFVEFRKKSKSPLTHRAKELAVRTLSKLKDSGCDPVLVIEQSILNGWKGLFQTDRNATSQKSKEKKLSL